MSSRYSVIHKIFPHVYKLRDNRHGHYVISKNYGDAELVTREVINLIKIKKIENENKNQNICFQKLYTDDPVSEDFCSIQTYYVPGNDLLSYYLLEKKIPEKKLKYLIENIYCGIKLLEENNLLHCDIKPENIVYEENSGKITFIDFYSLSCIKKNKFCDSRQGTSSYMSPEVRNEMKMHNNSDLWSLGITAATISIGFNPFHRHGVTYSNVQEHVGQLLEKEYSDEYTNTIYNLLHTKPEDRKFIHFK